MNKKYFQFVYLSFIVLYVLVLPILIIELGFDILYCNFLKPIIGLYSLLSITINNRFISLLILVLICIFLYIISLILFIFFRKLKETLFKHSS